MSKRIAIVVAIGLGILCLYLLQQSFANPVDIGGDQETATTGNDMRAGGGRESEEKDGALEGDPTRVAVREEVSAPSDPKLGILLVRVRWQDGKPAPNVAVALTSRRPVYHTVLRRLTNEQGVVQFGDLGPGEFEVSSHRGGRAKATVAAGKVVEAALELKGVDVHGVVVDATGAAVVDAEIWLTRAHHIDWLGGRVVARSDTRGEFRIRGVPPDQCLGALAKSFAPSDLVDLDDVDSTKVPVRVRLVVRERGGAVTGVVTSPAGDTVPAAVVCVGKQPRRFRYRLGSNSYFETWTPLGTTTDADGHFELPSVASGKHPVAIRARGLPIWKGEVVVRSGETSRLDVQLLDGVMVHGVVTDGAGQRIGGAIVRAYDKALSESFIQGGQFDYESVFGFPFTSADDQGRYRVAGIAPGSIHLYATRQRTPRYGFGTLVRAKAVLHGDAGEELLWNAVIEPGHQVSGLVTYKNGTPMKHCFINLRHEKTNKLQALVTDKEGRFRFTNLEPAYYKVGVQYPFGEPPKGTPPLEKGRIWPGMGEVRLVAIFDPPNKEPSSSVHGRIHDAGGRRVHAGPLGVLLKSDKNWWHTGKADKDGAFKFKRVRPGRFRLVVMSGEDQIHTSDWFEVAPAQKYDTGTIVTEPGGALRIRILREKGLEKIEPRLWATHVKTKQWREILPGSASDHLVKNLSVGSYQIRASGKGLSNATVNAEVKVGQEAVVDLPLRLGLRRTLTVTWPEDAGRLNLAIHDDGGGLSWQTSLELSAALPNPYKRTVYLPPGRYKAKAKTSKGLSAELSFEVKDQEETAPVISITLKPAK